MEKVTTMNTSKSAFDLGLIRKDFPLLSRKINDAPIIYADNAATTQKPLSVIRRLSNFYAEENSNVHRGVHALSEAATAAFEDSRKIIAKFINAQSEAEIIFTKGTTEAVNLVAQSYARSQLKTNDKVIITELEHHSNIVPWQIVKEQTGCELCIAPVSTSGEVLLEEFEKLCDERTKIVSFSHISNALGTINPVTELTKIAKLCGAKVFIDGAQATLHEAIDVQKIGCDFYAFSGHKAIGPTGIGILYGKLNLLEEMPPWQGGGDMIEKVSFKGTTYNNVPYKFEAGTPNIAGAIGLAEGIKYYSTIDLQSAKEHTRSLTKKCEELSSCISGLRVIGTATNKPSICSFIIDNIHPNDIGTLLDQQGIAIRSGHHCAMPLMEKFGIKGTARASFTFYNTIEEVEQVFKAIEKARKILA